MAINRIRVTGIDLETMRERILSKPDEVTDEIYGKLNNVGDEAVVEMKDIITNSPTPTGVARAAAGGNGPGRIDTGEMINRVEQITRKNKRSVSLRFGWLYGRPGYSFFQEYGTKFIEGMHALTDARSHADIKVAQILRGRK